MYALVNTLMVPHYTRAGLDRTMIHVDMKGVRQTLGGSSSHFILPPASPPTPPTSSYNNTLPLSANSPDPGPGSRGAQSHTAPLLAFKESCRKHTSYCSTTVEKKYWKKVE